MNTKSRREEKGSYSQLQCYSLKYNSMEMGIDADAYNEYVTTLEAREVLFILYAATNIVSDRYWTALLEVGIFMPKRRWSERVGTRVVRKRSTTYRVRHSSESLPFARIIRKVTGTVGRTCQGDLRVSSGLDISSARRKARQLRKGKKFLFSISDRPWVSNYAGSVALVVLLCCSFVFLVVECSVVSK